MLIMMAMATAVSAAEMAMENKEKKYPSSPPGNRKRLNTAKLMSVAFRISSMLISIASVLPVSYTHLTLPTKLEV